MENTLGINEVMHNLTVALVEIATNGGSAVNVVELTKNVSGEKRKIAIVVTSDAAAERIHEQLKELQASGTIEEVTPITDSIQ